MSEPQSEQERPILPPPGIALELTPPHVGDNWAAIDKVLRAAESWTQLVSAEDIRRQLTEGRMRAWGVLDHARQGVLMVGSLIETTRGKICRLWVLAATSDKLSLGALLDEGETFARQEHCVALEINTHPHISGWVDDKLTGAVFERDLRCPRITS
jgi:hypothetical protein